MYHLRVKNIMKNIILPVIALRGMTVLPDMVIHFDISRKKSIHAIEKAMEGSQKVFLTAQKSVETADPSLEDLYETGTIARIKQIIKLPNSIIRVLVEGTQKGHIKQLIENADMLEADILIDEEKIQEADRITNKAMITGLHELIRQYSAVNAKMSKDIINQWLGINSARKLLERIAIDYPMDYTQRQDFLEMTSLEDMYTYAGKQLIEDINAYSIKNELTERVKASVDKNQKDYIIREQLKVLNKELDGEQDGSEIDEFYEAVDNLNASDEIRDKIRKEIKRYKILSQGSAEANVERAYIETLLEMPWDNMSEDNNDLEKAQDILDKDHYGMKKVKERSWEFSPERKKSRYISMP